MKKIFRILMVFIMASLFIGSLYAGGTTPELTKPSTKQVPIVLKISGNLDLGTTTCDPCNLITEINGIEIDNKSNTKSIIINTINNGYFVGPIDKNETGNLESFLVTVSVKNGTSELINSVVSVPNLNVASQDLLIADDISKDPKNPNELLVYNGSDINWQKINNSNLNYNSVTSDNIVNETIIGSDILDNSISYNDLYFYNSPIAGYVLGYTVDDSLNKILKWDKIGSNNLKNDSVTTDHIVNGTIQGVDISDNQIITSKLANESVTENKLAHESVTENKLANESVTIDKLESHSSYPANGQVLSYELGEGGFMSWKNTIDTISNESITTNHILNGTIKSEDIGSSAITTSKLADDSVTLSKMDIYVPSGQCPDDRAQLVYNLSKGKLEWTNTIPCDFNGINITNPTSGTFVNPQTVYSLDAEFDPPEWKDYANCIWSSSDGLVFVSDTCEYATWTVDFPYGDKTIELTATGGNQTYTDSVTVTGPQFVDVQITNPTSKTYIGDMEFNLAADFNPSGWEDYASCTWSASGGTITNADNCTDAVWYAGTFGDYTIQLTATGGEETFTKSVLLTIEHP